MTNFVILPISVSLSPALVLRKLFVRSHLNKYVLLAHPLLK